MSDQVETLAEQNEAGGAAGEEQTPVVASAGEEVAAAQVETTPVAAAPETESVPEADAAPETETAAPAAPQAEAAAAPEPKPAETPEAEAKETESKETEANKRTVRMLSVGQQVTGTVKRVADFGAFVDIGVGRDGLIHISELSVRRVGKVTDVISEGQEITAWIKKLDRDRNRISLTLIDPGTRTIRDLEKGELVTGTVTRILPYGAFVDIGVGRDALLHVREMGEGYVAKPEDVVKVGEAVEARIIELSRRRGRVDLSLKGLRPEPEPVPTAPVQAAAKEEEPEVEEVEDTYADLDVLSPMQLAFKKAMQAEGIELDLDRKPKRRKGRDRGRSLQDEIIARTLASGKK